MASHRASSHNVNHFDISSPQELMAILRQSTGRVIMRYYRPGCPACDSSVGRWLEFVRRPDYHNVTFISANLEENAPLAREMGVDRIPTFICLCRGKPAVKSVGADMEGLRRLIETGAL